MRMARSSGSSVPSARVALPGWTLARAALVVQLRCRERNSSSIMRLMFPMPLTPKWPRKRLRGGEVNVEEVASLLAP